jgi:pimeloyl-ACP methyl ester carboxylesterase
VRLLLAALVTSSASAGAAILVAGATGSIVLVLLAALAAALLLPVLIAIAGLANRASTAGIIGLAGALSLAWLTPGWDHLPADTLSGTTAIVSGEVRLRVLEIPGATHDRPPVVFVHGGPGVSDMQHDAPALTALATDRDVFVYDQAGTGGSSRLDDPRGYPLHRSVQDLDAVRAFTGAPRVVLIGHSWGARIATAYAAEHPDSVAALVLTAPGPPPVSTRPLPAPDPASRLTASDRVALYADAMAPRRLFAFLLASADPAVGHAVAGDAEMDAAFATMYAHELPAMFCDPDRASLAGTAGVGFYANLVGQAPGDAEVSIAELRALDVPVLIVKPSCDYVPDSIAAEYLRLLPDARMVRVPGGHLGYLEHPGPWLAAVEAALP